MTSEVKRWVRQERIGKPGAYLRPERWAFIIDELEELAVRARLDGDEKRDIKLRDHIMRLKHELGIVR